MEGCRGRGEAPSPNRAVEWWSGGSFSFSSSSSSFSYSCSSSSFVLVWEWSGVVRIIKKRKWWKLC